jgi:hypothetical protein
MFVPVNCTACGKPFQVPEAVLGQSTACPWCKATVTALPVAAPVASAPVQPDAPKAAIPVAKPVASKPQPLSLDDDEPAPDRPRPRPHLPLPRVKSWAFHPLVIVAGLGISFLVMVLTVAVLGYGSGRLPESMWTEYTPPDGSCSVLLPDSPSEETVAANPQGSVLGGKRYVVKGWYTRTSAWLAWGDLDPGFAASLVKDKDTDKVFTLSAIQAELNREKTRLGGTVTKEAEIRFQNAWGIEVQMETPRGKVIERFILIADGPRPRLNVFGVQAKNVSHDSAVVSRMFTSFKVRESEQGARTEDRAKPERVLRPEPAGA